MERSIDLENVQIKTRRSWKSLVDVDSILIVDSKDIESMVVNPYNFR
jgi:hypothetical protein